MDIDKLGRYDIVRVLGRGAMGVVYEARDPYLDRQVAIKTIRVQSVSAEAAAEFSGRFRTEARSAARLQHPNIVSVFDSGQDGETSYLVMEFIQGDDLKRHLERGTHFSARASMKMVYDLLMALDHAHRQNVVHRDVKPANMLIEAGGNVKLADFGVARIQEPDEGNLTQLGTASVGTPRYMSPEQAQGLRVDARSDVFSAGVVLYELLTGNRPFNGENQFVVVNQIVSHPHVAPTRINPELPPAIDAVMDKALAKLPENRYATAREFALALRTVALQLPAAADETTTGFTLGNDGNLAGSSGSRNPLASAGNLGAAAGIGVAQPSGSNPSASVGDATQAHKVNQEIELEYWKDIKESTEPEDFAGFLGRFPNGIYADRARRRLERLNAATEGDNTTGGSTGSQVGAKAQDIAGLMRPWAPTVLEELPGEAGADAGRRPVPVAPQRAVARAEAATVAAPPAKPAPVPAKAAVTPTKATATSAVAAPQPQSRTVLYVGLALGVVVAGVAALWATSGSDGQAPLAPVAAPALAASAAASQPAPAEPAASEPLVPASSVPAGSSVTAAVASGLGTSAARAPASTARTARAASAAMAASAPSSRASVAAAQSHASASTESRRAGSGAAAATSARDAAGASSGAGNAPGSVASGIGPSSPGQVCADKVFVFKLTCLAEQCSTDTFRNSEECIKFREAARRREVNRPDM